MSENDTHLTRSLGFLLADVARQLRQRLDTRAATLGLTRAQWRVLAQLRRREGITQTALADLLEIEPITLVRHIDRLEAKGFVERRPDPSDRRARNLHLMPGARPVMDQMRELSDQTRQEALAHIPEEDAEKLIDMLLTIKETMQALPPLPAPRQPVENAASAETVPVKKASRRRQPV